MMVKARSFGSRSAALSNGTARVEFQISKKSAPTSGPCMGWCCGGGPSDRTTDLPAASCPVTTRRGGESVIFCLRRSVAHPEGVPEKRIALAKHLSAHFRILELVIAILEGDQFTLHAGALQDLRHAYRFLHGNVAVRRAVKYQHRLFEFVSMSDGRSFTHVRPFPDKVAHHGEIAPAAVLLLQGRKIRHRGNRDDRLEEIRVDVDRLQRRISAIGPA